MISASHPLTPSCVLFLFLWSSSESHGPPGIKQVLHATPRPPWHNRRRPGVMTDTCGNIIPTSHFYIPAALNQLQAHYPATEDVHPLSTHMQHFGLLWVHEPVQKITFHHRQKKKSPLNTSKNPHNNLHYTSCVYVVILVLYYSKFVGSSSVSDNRF